MYSFRDQARSSLEVPRGQKVILAWSWDKRLIGLGFVLGKKSWECQDFCLLIIAINISIVVVKQIVTFAGRYCDHVSLLVGWFVRWFFTRALLYALCIKNIWRCTQSLWSSIALTKKTNFVSGFSLAYINARWCVCRWWRGLDTASDSAPATCDARASRPSVATRCRWVGREVMIRFTSRYNYTAFIKTAYLLNGQTGSSAIRSADPENPTIEPNMKWIGWPLADIAIWNFPKWEVGRSSVVRNVAKRSKKYLAFRRNHVWRVGLLLASSCTIDWWFSLRSATRSTINH